MHLAQTLKASSKITYTSKNNSDITAEKSRYKVQMLYLAFNYTGHQA